jgi:hypothetical protein
MGREELQSSEAASAETAFSLAGILWSATMPLP